MVIETSNDKDRAFMMEQVRVRMKMMKVIHLALVIGVVCFGSFVLFYARKKFAFEISFQNPMIIIAVLLSAGTIIASLLLKKPYTSLPRTPSDIHDVLNRYLVFFLVRASMIEAGVLFSGVITLLTHNVVPAVFFLVSGVILAILRPSQHDLISLSSLDKRSMDV